MFYRLVKNIIEDEKHTDLEMLELRLELQQFPILLPIVSFSWPIMALAVVMDWVHIDSKGDSDAN
jgi:hypothetical protein